MCGIGGFVGEGQVEDLLVLGKNMFHRGPDGEGTFIDHSKKVFLIHKRLAILDIEGGVQPMWNQNRDIAVIFNGEIYNHAELREELVKKGHNFTSDHSDTEVLVHGYIEWGIDLPSKLNGMFAFAIYDVTRRKLFFARDRFGKKPLYYLCKPGLFCFASELKALMSHSRVVETISKRSLQKYFAYGFIPAPNSLYNNIYKLPGGCRMMFDIDSGQVKVDKYWEFRIEPEYDTSPNYTEKLCEELVHLLSQAVKRRLISDVPLGIFLSGGLDSSSILAFATRHLPPESIKTFSVGFLEPSFDESSYARVVAKHFKSSHHEEILGINSARSLYTQILNKLDEPMGDPSIIPTYQLCEFSKRYITVALGGDGGDELFAGYDPVKALGIANVFDKYIPDMIKSGIRTLADLLPVSENNMGFDFKIKRGLRGASYPSCIWNPVWLGPLDPGEIENLFNEAVEIEDVYSEAINAWNYSTADTLLDKTLEFYSRFYLQDDILTKTDRASMMNSMEVRSPYLDNDLVEFARRIPGNYKYRFGKTKYILKKALKNIVPDEILNRKKKGFGVPLTSWLKTWRENEFLPASYSDTNFSVVRNKFSEHNKGLRDNRIFLWCWLVLQHHKINIPSEI